MENNLCIIPARSGSKRIPNKNIKNFLGKPIISYSIETAYKSGLFNEIMVSTDSDEIKNISKKYGAKVPFLRSIKNSDDFATTPEVLIEVIEDYIKQGKKFKNILCLYPTAPFATSEKIIEGYNLLNNSNTESVYPITKFNYPILRSFVLDKNYLKYKWKKYMFSRSQDLQNFYHDAGQWYWIKCDVLLKYKSLYTNRTKGVILTSMEVQDIDEIEDWKNAELKYKITREKNN